MIGSAFRSARAGLRPLVLGTTAAILCAGLSSAAAQPAPNDVVVPSGYAVRELARDLGAAIAGSVASNGDLYVLASGFGGFSAGSTPGPVEIWKVTPDGQKTKVYSSTTQPGLVTTALGIAVRDDDTIFVNDGEGIKRVHRDGSVQMLAALPNSGDHANDHIAFGPDGKLYWGEGSATNSGVVGPDNQDLTGWLKAHPDFHDIPCSDVTLSGVNLSSKNVLSSDPNATTMTGPYLPFGTTATAGQVVKGQLPCTSAVLRMNPDGSGLEAVAWGFRNPFGIAFSPPDSVLKGALVISNNGADVRGSRPIENDGDDLYVVQPGAWYGWPDYFDEQPVTEPRFKPADGPQPAILLQSPNESQVLSAVTHFPKGVSADGFAFSTSDAFGWRNDLFIALWGPLGFGSQPSNPPGYNVYRTHFVANANGVVEGVQKDIFVRNKLAGPASQSGLNGLEHPSDVKFSPDGKTMYIVDFGQPPTQGGRVWAVTRTTGDAGGGVGPAPASQATPAAAPAAAPVAAPAPATSAAKPVGIIDFQYDPQTLTVAPGTTVTWTNMDSTAHTVTWDDKSVDSGLFGQGATFSYTFTEPGTYGYYCIPHGAPGTGMHGTVIVSGG